jgi:hypothetical protein
MRTAPSWIGCVPACRRFLYGPAAWLLCAAFALPAWADDVAATATQSATGGSAGIAPALSLEADAPRAARLPAATPPGAPLPLAAVVPETETPHVRVVRWARIADGQALGLTAGAGLPAPVAAGPFATPGEQLLPGTSELGLRWRTQWHGDRRFDVDAWRSVDIRGAAATERTQYHARVEMQFLSPARPVEVVRGALGLRLSANSQMMLKPHGRKPQIYYRATF